MQRNSSARIGVMGPKLSARRRSRGSAGRAHRLSRSGARAAPRGPRCARPPSCLPSWTKCRRKYMSDIRPPAYRTMTGTRVAMGPWQLLAAGVAAQAAISFVELGVPILAPFIKEGLGLSAFALGVLVGALNVGRFAGSVPAGQLADRLGERIVLIASGLGLCVFVILAAAASYLPILVALVFAGVFSGA